MTRSLMDWRDSVLAARSERIRRRRSRSTSMMRTEIGSPTIFCQRCSGVSPVAMTAAHGADLRGGHKAAQPADRHDQAALVETDDLALDNGLVADHLLDVVPGDLLLGALEGQHNVAVGVFGIDDVNVNFLTDLKRSAFFCRTVDSNSRPAITPSDLAPMLTRIWLAPMLAIIPLRISPTCGRSTLMDSLSRRDSMLWWLGSPCGLFASASPSPFRASNWSVTG